MHWGRKNIEQLRVRKKRPEAETGRNVSKGKQNSIKTGGRGTLARMRECESEEP